jgi:uncharacterized membrane protein YbhN (UPF0104 family)
MSKTTVRSPDNKKKWINVLKIALALTLVAALLLNTSVLQISDVFREISPTWLILSTLLWIVMNMTKGWQYYLLAQDKLPFISVMNVIFLQNVVTGLLAAGAGLVSSFAVFAVEHGLKPSRVLGMFLLVKLGDLIMIWLFLLVTGWLLWDTILVLRPILILTMLGLTAGIGMFFAAVLLRQRFLAALGSLLARLRLNRFSLVTRIISGLEVLASSDDKFLAQAMRRALIGAFVFFLVNVLLLYALARAFAFDIGMTPLVFVHGAQQLVAYVPIHVLGGLGVTDTSAVYLFSLFGHATSQLIAMMLGWRIFGYLINGLLVVYLLAVGAWPKRPSVEMHS